VDKTKSVLAPIPGVILSIAVKPGDAVVFGQELCVLEAMKMKNQIRANRAGKIAELRVAPGEQVRHSQVLFEYAD
jgi:biotin carboxyl carrier protein